ncbi:hypothetical protein PIB30_076389 [Stylosanthes scabra]|uniref:Uncharacterized protein n=1 Tax=Stylosanthes scabra TaxID=79078 RepID=A0ABU6XQ77_9FABA|nr:hypothetical protein [Stylosanthes scabra]
MEMVKAATSLGVVDGVVSFLLPVSSFFSPFCLDSLSESLYTTTEETDQLQRSKKKIRNDEGNFQGETSKVPRLETWMLDKTEFLNENGRRRTYADLVIHGTLEPQSDSEEDSEEESGDEGEVGEAERPVEWLEMSQFQREAFLRVQREEKRIPEFVAERL